MIRSTLMALLVAAVLAVSPASAVTAGGGLSISDPNPKANETFTVVVDAGTCQQVTLTVDAPDGSVTIDGDQTNEATKDVSGETVTFEVSIAVDGTFQIVSECARGGSGEGGGDGYGDNDGEGEGEVVVGGDVIAPEEEESPSPGVPPGDEDIVAPVETENGGGGILPSTGAGQLTTALAAGGVVLVLGGGVLLARRRRGTSHTG